MSQWARAHPESGDPADHFLELADHRRQERKDGIPLEVSEDGELRPDQRYPPYPSPEDRPFYERKGEE